MANNGSDYRLLTLADIEPAACILSQAFVDDPLTRFLMPFKGCRLRTFRSFFHAYSALSIRHQRGYGSGDPLGGVAYWKFPGQVGRSINTEYLAAFMPLLFTLYPIAFMRLRALSRKMEELRHKHAPEPHYYLDYIGVLPSTRGKGVASKLMRPFLDKADSESVVMYTDTNAPLVVPLYEHFGFHCVEECAVPGTGVTIWALRRPVHGKSGA